MPPKLIIQTDTPEEEANKVTKFLQYVILRQAVGMNPMDAVIDPVGGNYSAPVMTMGKKAMSPWMDGETRVSEYHGHIHIESGRLVGHTFGADSVIKEPNYLPVVSQEISNLLIAAKNPSVLDKPESIHHGPYLLPTKAVCDLEWDAKNRVTIVGFATSSNSAYSSHDVEHGLLVARKMLQNGATLIGHNLIAADLPHIGGVPRSWGPKHVIDTKITAHIVHAHFAQLGLLDLGSLVRFYFPVTDWKHDQYDSLDYNSYDCAYNWRLNESLEKDLKSTGQEHLVEPAQHLHAMTLTMADRGLKIDPEALRVAVNKKAEKAVRLKAELPFNPNSPKQVKEYLAKTYKIFIPDMTAETVKKLKKKHGGKHVELDMFFEARTDVKSLSTWFEFEADKKGSYISSPATIHPRFSVTGTAVARLSSSGPNFQNLPPEVRHLIVPRSVDLEFVSVDASQGENRWIAFIAEDTEMLSGFDAGLDNHQRVADNISKVIGITVSRHFAKTVVHASNYGETYYNLSNRLFGNVKRDSLNMAEALQEGYFKAYHRTRAWQLRVQKQLVNGDLMLGNPYGRKRFVYEMTEHDKMKSGCHFLGCSSCADMVNGKAVEIHKELGLTPVLIVHDELVYELERGDQGTRGKIAEILTLPIAEMGGRRGAWDMKVGGNYGKYSESNPNGLKAVDMPKPDLSLAMAA